MICTYCDGETEVFNSRHQKRANNVWRRRKCLACGSVFSTIEQVDYEKSWVVQYDDGTERPFLRDKLYISLYKSLGHRRTAATDATGLTATIIAKLISTTQTNILDVSDITGRTAEILRRFDAAAAIMYTAYHVH